MSKSPRKPRSKAEQRAETLEQLLDAAEALFSQNGFSAVTIKDIADKVGVHKSLVHYYFTDKQDVFDKVLARRAPVTSGRRMEALDAYERSVDGRPTVEGALRAFLDTDLDTYSTGGEGWRNFGSLSAQINNTPAWGAEIMDRLYDPVVLRLIGLLKKAMPDASDEDVFWGYHFVSGALTLTLARTGRIDRLSDGLCRSDDFEAVKARMAEFMAHGFIGICRSRADAREGPGMADAGGLAFASSPEAVGFDPERLGRLDAYMAGMVEAGHVAGAATLLMRHGQIVAFDTHGKADLTSEAPLGRDAIFRIYSMTKPVAGVALMILFEEGRWSLDDPVTRFLPELTDLRVFAGRDASGAIQTTPAHRPPTMRELLSHTAGFGYGLFDIHPVERAYREAGVLRADSLEQMVQRVADLPLMFQPGTEWFYSVAADLQGLIVQRLSGQSVGDFLQGRIFGPLGMVDTGFQTRPDNAHRLAAMYCDDGAGGLKPAIEAFDMPINDFTKPPPFEGGGGGLVSTAADYARFCQMILNGGELDGVRVLSPVSVALISTNVVPDEVLAVSNPLRLLPFNPAFGFGLDFAVALDPRRIGMVEGRGTLSWGGGGGTWFWIDPENDIVFVGMIQRMADPVSSEFRNRARTFVYQALTHPEK